MCGICGICNSSEAVYDIRCMMNSIIHRGPDDGAEYVDSNNGVAFGHRRLSIIDLSEAGRQPMQSMDKRYIIVFNGEIYNHLELKDFLADDVKNQLKSTTDTEILLELFSELGIIETLNIIRGMFAIALYDRRERSIYLMRDRAGEKPLYYGFINNMFVFSSELKAIRSIACEKGIGLSINNKAIGMFLRHSYIPAPYSIYNEIYKVEPAGIVKIKYPFYKIENCRNYWRLKENVIKKVEERKAPEKELSKLLYSTISEQMIADVPYGAFLSGGIDSSLIVSYMQKISKEKVKTFSIGFETEKYNEAPYAREIASCIGTEHRELYVTDVEAMNVIPDIPEIYDEPYADSSQIPTYLVAKLAKECVSVVLTGDAGDELFCGYEHYKIIEAYFKRINMLPQSIKYSLSALLKSRLFEPINRRTFNNKINKLSRALRASNIIDFYYEMLRIDTAEDALMKPGISADYFASSINYLFDQNVVYAMQLIDFYTYLPNDILVKVDRAAMHHSLETRVPFLDKRIIEFAYSLPMEYKYNKLGTKAILRELLYDEIPRELLERPKKGFSIPLDDWLRGPLKEWAEEMIYSEELRALEGFDHGQATAIWKKHLYSKENYKSILWNVIILAQWLQNDKKYKR